VARQLGDMARHAGRRYRRLLGKAAHPVEELESEARHLHEVEQRGEAGATPFIALGGLILFLLPIVLVSIGIAFAVYYLAA
jgi:hypothetical protein